ncbi:MAG: aminoglycoside phosphotransferase family protein, partial [Clostridia bacterium]|nr:aminoglycoside phosphotransferase family protein [Clostridia bacterium]
MTRNENCAKLGEALAAFLETEPLSCAPYGNGHINDTFLVTTPHRYILQRMNQVVFPRPDKMMENIQGVTEHILKKARERGGDCERATLVVCPTRDGAVCFQDSIGQWWRMYEFTERTVTKERVENPHDFYTCGEAFGRFQMELADYPAETLYPVIPNFHHTPMRMERLKKAIAEDVCGRAKEVASEIAFALERAEFAETLERAHADGRLPLRVTHNDTKLNNILFDEKTGEPVCVVDLDTVMPGYSVNDFGDSIRFGANTAAEDET